MYSENREGAAGPPRSIRRATGADIPFILEIARQAYPGRPVEQALPWARWVLDHPDRLVLVGNRTAGVASIAWKYGIEQRAKLDMLCALPGAALEPLAVLREMLVWARSKGVTRPFQVDGEEGVDLGFLVSRFGGRRTGVVIYEIPLGD